jgi:chromosomal replication initiation ATPase DnaA
MERPMRDLLIYLIWKQGSFPLAEIGEKFQIGHTSISNARIRGEAAMQKYRKLRSKLKKAGIDV